MTQSVKVRVGVLSLALVGLLRLTAPGQDPGEPQREAQAEQYLGSHHIDRYEAIQQLVAALRANPKQLQDWIILGELSQEVAHDSPRANAAGYYRLARQSYEAALKLSPNDENLKAAAAFTKQQEEQAEANAQARTQATTAYLNARRQELAQPGAGPRIRTYQPATAANGAGSYYYRPYVAEGMEPYTYQNYVNSYYPFSPQRVGPIEPQPGRAITRTEAGALVKPGAAAAPP